MTTKFSILLVGYMVFFFGALAGVSWWQRRQRKPKSPFKEGTKLLRGPGESLLKKIAEMDDALTPNLLIGMGGPFVIALFVPWALGRWGFTGAFAILGSFGVTLLAATCLSAYWLVRKAAVRSNHYLGYFGERVVAETLEPLKAYGWRIFHDVPGEKGKKKFNVDHVAIGPGGVFAIETKTRRKGNAIKGREDQKVFYDGKKLRWPWGDEKPHGVEKAVYRANWLAEWLETVVGKKVPVRTILTFPEWYVVESPKWADPRLRVVPAAWLVDVIQEGEADLNERQIDFLARQLEQRCRDVEY